MTANLRDTLLGLAAVLVIAGIFAYATWGDAIAEGGGYRVAADFNRVDGIVVGSAVRLAGVEVGRVAAIDLLRETDRARLSLVIDDGINVPADSVAAIQSDSLFSDRFVRVDPGGDTKMLSAGDRFAYTQDSIDVIGMFQKLVENAEQQRGIKPHDAFDN